MNDPIRDRRVQYETAGLDLPDLDPDPVAQWHRWHGDAAELEVAEPNAMTVSTVGADGVPDARILLARAVDARGIVFYTNYDSDKSRQLTETASAALVFAWLDLHRQVRVRGAVERISPEESDAYFAARPRGSQIGAWSSPQSSVLADRAELEERVAANERRFDGVEAIPRPEFWGGWRLVPSSWEFWQGRPSRLHDRFRYRRPAGGEATDWIVDRLAP